MTTDITELAQRMKAAAVRAKTATEEYASGHMSVSVCYAECEEFNRITDGPDNILALVEALEKAQTINAAAEKLVRCKGRYHSEQNYRVLAALFGVTAPDLPPLDSESRTLTAAAADVLEERQRQVTAEGWTTEHDDEHSDGEMALAASSYALYAHKKPIAPAIPYNWPWEPEWFKQQGARRDLVKAGALILAEIERIDRTACINEESK